MVESLEDFFSQLQGQEDKLLSFNEEAAKQAVLPILSLLGWDVHNTLGEVCPEYPVGKDRVDYCLKIAGNPRVFVEAKRPGENLKNHEDQLLRYSYDEGVDLAALTTGFSWWLYLPMARVKKDQRRFATIQVDKTGDAARLLRKFLVRDALADGSGIRAAEDALIANVIPLAWGEVYQDEREHLLKHLAQKVHGLSGYNPDTKILTNFLSWLSDPKTTRVWNPPPSPGGPISTHGETAEKEGSICDERYWLRESPWTLETARALLTIVKPLIGEAELKFVQGYIAIVAGKSGNNYFSFQKRASNRSLLWVQVSPEAVAEAALALENAGLSCARGKNNVQVSIDKEKVESNPKLWERIAGFAMDFWKS